MKYEPTKWRDISAGMTIVCPSDGQPEKVTFARNGGLGRRHVRTERHDHIRDRGQTVPAARDTGHRDVTYRTVWGTAIATRPGFNAPWWLHLPHTWKGTKPPSRTNTNGAFFFRSEAAVRRWLEPLLDPEPPGAAPDQQARRAPGTQPIRRGGYT